MAVAVPFIALALTTAVGTGVAVYAAKEQGKAAEEAGKFNEAVARNDALAQSQQAQYEANQARRRSLIMSGRQRAAYAKSGVTLSGSADDVMYDSEIQGELDALAALYTGKVRSNYATSSGQLARLEGDNAKTASNFHAAGSLLTGAGQFAQQYQSYQSSKPPRME